MHNIQKNKDANVVGAIGPLSPPFVILVDELNNSELTGDPVSKEIEKRVNESIKSCLEDLLKMRVEYLQTYYNCPVEILMRDFHFLLRDNAKECCWIYIRNTRNADWSSLRHSILFKFQSTTSYFEVMRDVVDRRQQMNESVDANFHAMLKLVTTVPEFDIVSIIKTNLRDSIARIVYPMSIYSVDQWRHECYKIKQNFGKRKI